MALTATGWHREVWKELMAGTLNDFRWTNSDGAADNDWNMALFTSGMTDVTWVSDTSNDTYGAGNWGSNEVSNGNGYATSGEAIGTAASDRVAAHNANGTIYMGCTSQSNLQWAATGGSIDDIEVGCVYFADGTDNFVVVGYKFSAVHSISDGGTFTVNWDDTTVANSVFTIG